MPAGHAEALTVFISLALRKNAARGIVDRGRNGNSELSAAIQSIARAHFEVDEAIAGWRRALTTADLASMQRDDERAAGASVQHQPDVASFYAGLAFGLVFAGPCAVAAWAVKPGIRPRQREATVLVRLSEERRLQFSRAQRAGQCGDLPGRLREG